jgi:hypothetical protein
LRPWNEGRKLRALNTTVNKKINTCNRPLVCSAFLLNAINDGGTFASVARIPCKRSTSRTITVLMLGRDRLYKCDAPLSSHFTVPCDTPAALARDAVVNWVSTWPLVFTHLVAFGCSSAPPSARRLPSRKADRQQTVNHVTYRTISYLVYEEQ